MDLPNFGLETKPYLIYEAKKGTFKHVVDKQKNPISLGEFIADLENYATGWGNMAEGQAPQWAMNKNRAVFGPIPSDAKDKDGKPAWKQGIRVSLFSPATFGGDGLCDFDTTGFGARTGIFDLLKKFVSHPDFKPGMVPVCKFTGYVDHGTGSKATTIPQFDIVKFIARPAALSGAAPAQQQAVVHQAAPTPVAKTANEF